MQVEPEPPGSIGTSVHKAGSTEKLKVHASSHCMQTLVHACAHMHVSEHAHMHAYALTHMRTLSHTYLSHTHTHARTHAPMCTCVPTKARTRMLILLVHALMGVRSPCVRLCIDVSQIEYSSSLLVKLNKRSSWFILPLEIAPALTRKVCLTVPSRHSPGIQTLHDGG